MPATDVDPRPRLDVVRIVDVALAIADREGADAVTMRRLGAELGVDGTAVYRYFRSKRELLAAMADRLFAATLEAFPDGDDWRANLRACVMLGYATYRRHPGFARALAEQGDDGEALTRIAEYALRQLAAGGCSDEDAAITYQALVDLVVGVGVYHGIVADMFEERTREALRRSYAALDGERHPTASRLAPHLFQDPGASFERAVDLLLDGLAARLRAQSTLRENEEDR